MVFSACNICGSTQHREICAIEISPILTPSKLVQCKECGFFFANPRLSKKEDEHHYKAHYHKTENKKYWLTGRADIFKRDLLKIGKFLKKGRLIDVGCGMGYFMDLARCGGLEVKGVDVV